MNKKPSKIIKMVSSQRGVCNYIGDDFKVGRVIAFHKGKRIRERLCPICGCGHASSTKGLWGV